MEEKKEYPKPGKKKVQLFIGRMQPVHLGHKKIIDSMTNPVIVIVKGEKSSEDRLRNPFSAEYQIKLIKKIAPQAEIITASSGYLPKILAQLREKGMEVDTIYAGADRITGYKKQIESANAKMDPEYRYNVKFKETDRVTSATAVRNAIRSGDEQEFRKLMPKELWGEFETMKKTLSESFDFDLLSFEEWLNEEGEGSSLNTSDQIAQKDQPLGIKKKKKKNEEDECEEDESESE
jgi:nicotinamide mononucleotide adenylyltransferase